MDLGTIDNVSQIYRDTIDTLDKVLVGQSNVKKVVASAILCDTNSKMLLTGDIGMGKTTLAAFLANSFNSERISVTSDLIPTDIFNQLKNKQHLRFLHLDEFNRANGKVQSAFIELFAEKQLSIGGDKYTFGDFYVLATQNSKDISGVFSVPQTVYDRFDVNIFFEELTEEDKRRILFAEDCVPSSIIREQDILFTKKTVDNFKLRQEDQNLFMQMFDIIDTLTFNNKKLFAGSNIRAHKFAIKLAKLNALVDGRDYILPRDLVSFINYLYNHRINQNIVEIREENVLTILDEAKSDILSLKRQKN